MKWILISTKNNPGDSFARYGVERLIWEVDPKPQLHLLDKEDPAAWGKRDFDRIIYCGQPIFWSHREQTCSEIWWWHEMFHNWPTDNPRKFMCMGVGDYVGPDGIFKSAAYMEAISEAISKSFAVTTRNHIVNDPRLIESVCPSLFAFEPDAELREQDTLRLCNLMEHGAHEPHMATDEAKVWTQALPRVADDLIRQGYEFVAHSKEEMKMAERLGFRVIHRFFEHHNYLLLYRRCVAYVGNRLHGAMVAARAGAHVTAIGYDSRVKMLDRIGIHAHTPIQYLSERWPLGDKISPTGEAKIALAKKQTIELLRRFMEGE